MAFNRQLKASLLEFKNSDHSLSRKASEAFSILQTYGDDIDFFDNFDPEDHDLFDDLRTLLNKLNQQDMWPELGPANLNNTDGLYQALKNIKQTLGTAHKSPLNPITVRIDTCAKLTANYLKFQGLINKLDIDLEDKYSLTNALAAAMQRLPKLPLFAKEWADQAKDEKSHPYAESIQRKFLRLLTKVNSSVQPVNHDQQPSKLESFFAFLSKKSSTKNTAQAENNSSPTSAMEDSNILASSLSGMFVFEAASPRDSQEVSEKSEENLNDLVNSEAFNQSVIDANQEIADFLSQSLLELEASHKAEIAMREEKQKIHQLNLEAQATHDLAEANEKNAMQEEAIQQVEKISYNNLLNKYANIHENNKQINKSDKNVYNDLLDELKQQITAFKKTSPNKQLLADHALELLIACSPEYGSKIDFLALEYRTQLELLIALKSTVHVLQHPEDSNNARLMQELYTEIKDYRELGANSALITAISAIALVVTLGLCIAASIATAGVAVPFLAALATPVLAGIAGGSFLAASASAFGVGYGLTETKVVAATHNMHRFFEKDQTDVNAKSLQEEEPSRDLTLELSID